MQDTGVVDVLLFLDILDRKIWEIHLAVARQMPDIVKCQFVVLDDDNVHQLKLKTFP